jgi:hypothetical protein
MKKHLALLVVGLAAAASFATPASAIPPVCETHTPAAECVKDLLGIEITRICIPTGDLEDDCRIGG